MNGLKMAIQDQVSLQWLYKVSDAYQLALKVEVQLARNTPRKLVTGCTSGASTSKLGVGAKGKGIAATINPTIIIVERQPQYSLIIKGRW